MEEIFPIFWPYYAMALVLAMGFGAIAQRSRFCLQGGLRDWRNLGNNRRLMTYIAAMAFTVLACSVVESLALTDLSNTKPGYRSSEFAWGRYLAGGFIFGFGMVLAAGCGFRQLIKSGEGSVKALWLVSIMAIAIYLLTRTTFFGLYVLPVFQPLSVSLSSQQDIGSLTSASHAATFRIVLGAIVSAIVAWQLVKQKASIGTWLTAVSISTVITLGYLLTGGEYALFLADEASFMDTPPNGLGSQSFTVSAPLGDVVYFLDQRAMPQLTFGVLAITGVWIGALISAISGKKFSLQGFDSWRDFSISSLGALLAAFGSVLAMGCSVGHGLTGIATLSIGSILAITAIVAGGMSAIKIRA
jgi:uncharacterized membrane protein YedE/YeeE